MKAILGFFIISILCFFPFFEIGKIFWRFFSINSFSRFLNGIHEFIDLMHTHTHTDIPECLQWNASNAPIASKDWFLALTSIECMLIYLQKPISIKNMHLREEIACNCNDDDDEATSDIQTIMWNRLNNVLYSFSLSLSCSHSFIHLKTLCVNDKISGEWH